MGAKLRSLIELTSQLRYGKEQERTLMTWGHKWTNCRSPSFKGVNMDRRSKIDRKSIEN
ncbi:hypothetical protein AXF42_Ash015694 [Apostasia shenzhenica]|uniref:Uncharacterized protein n=1 Tax=Apostasia shenzhenica TaxID=1088818 RepID=A0A2H9ZU43_9ASPA|nr:hypothetical protein AXF42_Ash015694 [Apostasia shenzhenica]